jgi:nucleoside triphosphate diphosphatase
MPHTPLIFAPDGSIERLRAIMRALRDPDTGCPWDIEQDFTSIAPYTIEEAYEVADAIEQADWPALEGELGDLLLQVIYHAQMGEEAGHFTLDSITRAISDKMVARHPHVLGMRAATRPQKIRCRIGKSSRHRNARRARKPGCWMMWRLACLR